MCIGGSINIYTWDGYFNPETISAFTEETGIEVNFSPFASNEDMLVVMENGAAYDIVLASDYALNILRKADLLQPLDMEALSQLRKPRPGLSQPVLRPRWPVQHSLCSQVRRCWFTTPNWLRAKSLPFADLFDEQFVDSVCLLDSARVMIGYVNMMLGHDFNTTDDTELAEAAEALQQIKPNVLALDSNLAYQYLLSGEAKAAFLFTSQAVVCEQAMPGAFEYVFPSEGIGFGVDAMVIPASAENPEGANAFLNYMMRRRRRRHHPALDDVPECQCCRGRSAARGQSGLRRPQYSRGSVCHQAVCRGFGRVRKRLSGHLVGV